MLRNMMLVNEQLFDITRKIFYYGCYSAKDFQEMDGVKGAAFSRYKNFLQAVFGKYIEEIPVSGFRSKALRFKTDEYEIPFNILLDLYTLKKISERDFLFFLEMMMFFTGDREKQSFSLSDLTKGIATPGIRTEEAEKANISDPTVQRNLKELADYGYLVRTGKKKFLYRKPESLLMPLNPEELWSLTAFADLCRNFCHPAVCGHYLMDTIDLINQQKNTAYHTLFQCKHLHMGQVLEDGSLWKLITAIHNRKIIRFENKRAKMRFHQPYKIIINEADGRRYLFCIPLEDTENQHFLYRIDRIFNIREEKGSQYAPLSAEQAEHIYSEQLGKSFTGTTVFQGALQTAVLIYQTAFYPEIQKHFPDAVPEHADNQHDKVQIAVNSLTELKPWLRKNIGKVRITDTSDDTAQEMEQELNEWRAMYGIT